MAANAPNLLPTGTTTWVSNWVAFIKAHERLVVVAVLALLGFHFYHDALNLWDKIDSRHVQEQTAALATTTRNNQDLQTKLDAQNAALQQQIKIGQAQSLAIQQASSKLTALQAAQKLGGTAVDAQTVSLPLPTAQKDIASLEELPIIQNELDAETKLADTQAQLITGLNKQLVDETNVCKAEVAAEKVKTKKALLRGMKIGGVAGYILGLLTGIGVHG